MSVEFGKIMYELTARSGDEAWVARRYQPAAEGLPRRLEWAYGPTLIDAGKTLLWEPTVIALEDLEAVV